MVEEEAVEVGVLRARDGDLVRTSRVVERSRVESNRVTDEIGGLFLATVCLLSPSPTGNDDKSHRYICARSDVRKATSASGRRI